MSNSRVPLEKATKARIYRKAARKIEDGDNHWSCCAIAGVGDDTDPYYYEDDRMLVGRYERFFKPDGAHLYWGNAWSDRPPTYQESCGDEQAKKCRILALCFMAAMAGAGDA